MQTCEESTYDTLKIPKYKWCQSLNSYPKKLYGFTKKEKYTLYVQIKRTLWYITSALSQLNCYHVGFKLNGYNKCLKPQKLAAYK